MGVSRESNHYLSHKKSKGKDNFFDNELLYCTIRNIMKLHCVLLIAMVAAAITHAQEQEQEPSKLLRKADAGTHSFSESRARVLVIAHDDAESMVMSAALGDFSSLSMTGSQAYETGPEHESGTESIKTSKASKKPNSPMTSSPKTTKASKNPPKTKSSKTYSPSTSSSPTTSSAPTIFCFKSKADLQDAVNSYIDQGCSTANTDCPTRTTFGEIGTWCTSLITDMILLFYAKSNFNDDISDWDVSSVTNMTEMFFGASAFNRTLCPWGKFLSFPYDESGGMFLNSLTAMVPYLRPLFFRAT